MGASREMRESEKTVMSIAQMLIHLGNLVWKPMADEAIEYINMMRNLLDTLEAQLIKEKK